MKKSLCLVCLLPLFPAANLGPDPIGQNTQLHTLAILTGWASQSTLGHLLAFLGHGEKQHTNTGPDNSHENLWPFKPVVQFSSFEEYCQGP